MAKTPIRATPRKGTTIGQTSASNPYHDAWRITVYQYGLVHLGKTRRFEQYHYCKRRPTPSVKWRIGSIAKSHSRFIAWRSWPYCISAIQRRGTAKTGTVGTTAIIDFLLYHSPNSTLKTEIISWQKFVTIRTPSWRPWRHVSRQPLQPGCDNFDT